LRFYDYLQHGSSDTVERAMSVQYTVGNGVWKVLQSDKMSKLILKCSASNHRMPRQTQKTASAHNARSRWNGQKIVIFLSAIGKQTANCWQEDKKCWHVMCEMQCAH